jgi:hypothetical protein
VWASDPLTATTVRLTLSFWALHQMRVSVRQGSSLTLVQRTVLMRAAMPHVLPARDRRHLTVLTVNSSRRCRAAFVRAMPVILGSQTPPTVPRMGAIRRASPVQYSLRQISVAHVTPTPNSPAQVQTSAYVTTGTSLTPRPRTVPNATSLVTPVTALVYPTV